MTLFPLTTNALITSDAQVVGFPNETEAKQKRVTVA
jgi:hypothetical protein